MNIHHTDEIFDLLRVRFGIVGYSQPMREALKLLLQAAPTELAVLINGETGTGKEIFANAIHGLSKRKNQPYVSVNCAAIPENLLESELFGHEKGAFTGAYEQRAGFFETANKGTIFLDEIGDIPLGTQVKLLRILENGEYSRLGSSSVKKVDVRIIAATNRDLEQEVKSRNFRQDLYFRLNSVKITLPPLRNHPDDIPYLIDHFAHITSEKHSIDYDGFDKDSIEILKTLPWPGNVRELRNLVEKIVTLEKGIYITPEILRTYIPRALPAYQQDSVNANNYLAPLPKPDHAEGYDAALIFRTLLELKTDISDIKKNHHDIVNRLEDLKQSQFYTTTPVNNDKLDDDEIIEKLDDINLAGIEIKLIKQALKRFHGNRRKAAIALGISERTLYRKITENNIDDYL